MSSAIEVQRTIKRVNRWVEKRAKKNLEFAVLTSCIKHLQDYEFLLRYFSKDELLSMAEQRGEVLAEARHKERMIWDG